MGRSRSGSPVKRVQMRSSGSTRTALVAEDQVARFRANGWSEVSPSPRPAADAPEGYDAMTVADLKAEIEARNEGRDEADRIGVTGKKADLVAALEADAGIEANDEGSDESDPDDED